MKVYIEIDASIDINSFYDEIKLVVEGYYLNYQVQLVFIGWKVIPFNVGEYKYFKCENNIERDLLKAIYCFDSGFDGENKYIIHELDGNLTKGEEVSFSLHEEAKNSLSLIKENKKINFYYNKPTNILEAFLKDDNLKLLSRPIRKLNKESCVILSQLDDIFIMSSFSNDSFTKIRTTEKSELLDMKLFKLLKANYFVRKQQSSKSPFLSTFYSEIYNVVDNVSSQEAKLESSSNKQVFKSYKSLSNLALYLAKYKIERNYSNLSYITGLRVLELYLTGYLILTNDLIVKSDYKSKLSSYLVDSTTNKKINGLGSIWWIVKDNYNLNKNIVSKVDEFIYLRNSHLYGHGFDLNGEKLSLNLIQTVENVIFHFEKKLPFKDNSWDKFSCVNKKLFEFNFIDCYVENLLQYYGVTIVDIDC